MKDGKIKMINSWNEMNLDQWLKIQTIYDDENIEPEDKTKQVLAVLTNEDVSVIDKLSIQDFYILSQQLDFMKYPVEKTVAKNKVKIGDNVYNVVLDLSKVSVAQYFDFQSFMSKYNESKSLEDLISIYAIFLIPEGKNYNEDYDFEQVRNDARQLKVTLAVSINDFFFKFFQRSMKIMLRYLTRKLKMTKEMKNQVKELETQILNIIR